MNKKNKIKLIDLHSLRIICGNDIGQLHNIKQQFIITTQQDLKALEASIKSYNKSNIFQYAHRIKGAAQIIGAKYMIEITALLENESRENNPPSQHSLTKLLNELKDNFMKVTMELNLIDRDCL